MFKKLATVTSVSFLALGLAATSAQASTLLDFTSTAVQAAVQAPTSGQVAFAGTTATISTTGGALTWNPPQDGSTCDGTALACELDGLGVRDDEISGGTQESIRIDFGAAVTLDAIYFLDLFSQANGNGQEKALVSYDGGSMEFFSDANETPTGDSGYLFMALLPRITTTWLSFMAPDYNPGDGLGRNDYSVAAISAVPLPAALPLYGAGLAVMGLVGWRRKRKEAQAA